MTAVDVKLPPAGSYRIDPIESSIRFATRHIFGLGRVAGSFAFASGQITIAGPPSAPTASAVIDAASFKTDNARRDKDVKSPRFLHVDAHPQITFDSGELARNGDVWLLRGRLTVRGTTTPVEVTVRSLSADQRGLTGMATTRIDRYASGLTKMKGMAARYLNLEISVRATRVTSMPVTTG